MSGLIAEALAAACRDPAVLARLGGPLGDAVRARARELGALPAEARKLRRATWAATARAPLPAGMRGIDPSWIEAALSVLPARAREDLATGGRDPAGVWLARWAAAGLTPLPPARHGGPPGSLDEAIRLPAEDVLAWLADVGADQLALAISAAGPDAIRRAAAVVGTRLVTAAARIAVAPRAGALGPMRAAIARCQLALDDTALVRIGARAIAPHTDAIIRRQLVLRFPPARGLVIGGELARDAAAPLAQAPTWAAIAAAG